MTTCRCGWTGVGEHPCHGNNYTCKAPSVARYYEPQPFYSLAGAQLKKCVTQTYACDVCWREFWSLVGKEPPT